ncbi:hypothetical protein NGRA_3329 [Nosema granulosis]|uniref:Uncharacterized protein n=1 Tax=Nosema granulosis TaxID=83296 RepID=A0A9P6GUY1_9MICR|nr:hypothetical protein NGRA_3329 [Nosema granulosis]
MKDHINRVLKESDKCIIYNRKTTGGSDFVVTKRKLEKVALDLMDIGGENRYVLLGIDYFTRRLWGSRLKSKESCEVIKMLQKWIKKDVFQRSTLLITVESLQVMSLKIGV